MVLEIILAGLNAIKDYILTYVLTSLIPAFLLAGAIVTFVSREAIVTHLGTRAKILPSFGIAALSGFLLATDSMTIIPVADSIFSVGASLGAVFVLLWVAPAANILALVYTGTVIGSGMVVARLVAAIITSVIIGLVMAFTFRKEDKKRVSEVKAGQVKFVSGASALLLILLALWLIVPNYIATKAPSSSVLIAWSAGLLIITVYTLRFKSREKQIAWIKETWSFVKAIVPLLLAGVFVIGVIGLLLPADLAMSWVGGSGLKPAFIASLVGAVMYFPNLTETAFADTLINMGMGNGSTLALLLNATGTSLPSWFVIGKIFGVKKSVLYAALIIILGTLAGLIGEVWIRS